MSLWITPSLWSFFTPHSLLLSFPEVLSLKYFSSPPDSALCSANWSCLNLGEVLARQEYQEDSTQLVRIPWLRVNPPIVSHGPNLRHLVDFYTYYSLNTYSKLHFTQIGKMLMSYPVVAAWWIYLALIILSSSERTPLQLLQTESVPTSSWTSLLV